MDELLLVVVTTVTVAFAGLGLCLAAAPGPARIVAANTAQSASSSRSLAILPSFLSESKVLHQLGGMSVQVRRFFRGSAYAG